MLAEVGRVQIGANEAAILSLVRRYGGHKWDPDQDLKSSPPQHCVDPWGCEHDRRMLSDYTYSLEIQTWWYPTWVTWDPAWTGPNGRRVAPWERALRNALNAIPARVRPLLGMRDWNVAADIRIRSGRVFGVNAGALLEGRPGWHLHEWVRATEMPEENLQSRSFAVLGGSLTGPPCCGGVVEVYLTPKASPEEVRAAHALNTACLTSLRGCDGSCEASPLTLQYLTKHPDPHFNAPKCP